MRISEISVHRPVFASVLSLLLLVIGGVSLARLWQTMREYPDVSPPVVSIDTRYRGAAAQVVETKITQPLEERIAGIEGIDKIRSQSFDERSSITIEFNLDRSLDAAAADVRDRVARVLSSLPPEADAPEVTKADASADPVMFMNLSSETLSPLELTDYAERNLIDRFAALPGVARVRLAGERRFAMRVWIDRTALAARELTVADVEAALRRENVELPAGRIESRQREFVLNTDTGLAGPDDFRQIVVARSVDGALTRLGDVAEVSLGAANERSVARTLGVPGFSMAVEAQSNANTRDVSRAVREEIERLKPALPKGMELTVNIDDSLFIDASIREVLIALAISLALVIGVIYAFLGSARATLIPAVTIPVSIIAACAAMYALGFTINVLTLLGAVLAIGLVVDDAIVVLENIYRRIERGQPSLLAALDGSREIGFAVIATTLVLTAVFVPVSFLGGRVGRLFGEFGFTLAASIAFSCLVALTLTPMMTAQLFRNGAARGRFSHWLDERFRRLSERYRQDVAWVVARPWPVVLIALALFGGALVLAAALPSESTPSDDRGAVRIGLQGPEGASLEYMERHGRELERMLFEEMQAGDVARFNMRVPGGGPAGGGGEVNRGQAFLVLKPWEERERSAADIAESMRARVATLSGVRAFVAAPSAFNWGGSDPIRAVLQGPDYQQLVRWRDIVMEKAAANPGLQNVDSDYKERKPQIRVSIDRDRAAELGVSLDAVGRTLETMLGSRIVTTFIRSGREYDVILQGRADDRASPTDLDRLYVRSTRDELIALSSIIRLEESATTVQRNRFDRLPSITITAAPKRDYSMGEAIAFFRSVVASDLPAQAKLSFDGESREYLRSSSALYWTFAGALLFVFLVLAAQFESFKVPFVIMTTVPLALIGAIVGLWLSDTTINIFSQIAVIMLVGLAAKNGVLIVEFANQLRDRGVVFTEAIAEAAVTRLRPVLMTSLCSGLGALPLLLATGAGAESREPIGVVVFYGVMLSMVLTLAVVPAVYVLVARNTRSPRHWTRLIDGLRAAGPAPAPGLNSSPAAGQTVDAR